MNHGEAFAKAFITSEKRARFIQFLADPKRPKEMLGKLNQDLPDMPEFGSEVPDAQDYPEELEKLLKARRPGQPVYVLADGLKADRRTLPLREALHLICMHELGAILSRLAGRLAYDKPESPRPGLVLERPQARRPAPLPCECWVSVLN
ncbi:MAG TPA: hypothetical protein VJ486_02655 [Geothrix sp.]|nr:hypothetical protein [Geothrix sp.]